MAESPSWPDRSPGALLAAELAEAGAGLVGLSDDELVDVLAAWRRQASWAHAGELAAVAELARRRECVSSRDGEFTSAEVGLALRISPRSAGAHVEFARALAGRLPLTREALSAGRIDLVKARVIAQGTYAVADDVARAVERRVLPGAPDQTPGRLRARVERAVIALDPSGAERRRKSCEADRRVECYDTGNGTAVLTGVHLPAGPAIAADNRLHAIAKAIKADGDPRTLTQVSADVFVSLMLGTHPASGLPTPELTATLARAALNASLDPATGDPASVEPATGASASVAPAGVAPAGVAPAGVDPASVAPAIGASASVAPASVEPASVAPAAGGTAHDQASAVRPDRPAASPARLDRSAAAPARPRQPAANPATPDRPAATGAVLDSALEAAAVARAVGGRIGTVHVTVPLLTLLGLAEEPGEAAGYGPLTAEIIRQMAAAASAPATRWCVTVTGPDGSTVHHGHPTYRPPAAMTHLVHTLQPTCRFPGCTHPARACDLDHRIPYEQGGPTCPCNLQPLCRRHHRLKQATGWQITRHHDRLAWTTPAGKTYLTEPAQPPPHPTHGHTARESPIETSWRRRLLDLHHDHQPRPSPQRQLH